MLQVDGVLAVMQVVDALTCLKAVRNRHVEVQKHKTKPFGVPILQTKPLLLDNGLDYLEGFKSVLGRGHLEA